MSGLDRLKTRINYTGNTVQKRYEKDKLRGLRQALKFSYQSETVILNDGREFKALINRDNLKKNYDDKILSIPYQDICLNKPRVGKTTGGLEIVGLKVGDTFTWKENNTHWIIYMQQIQEMAQFKSGIRRCRHIVTFGDKDQWVYINQPDVLQMIWTTKQDRFSWNDLNYKLQMFVTRDEITSKYFQRFTKIKIDGDVWEVVSSDEISVEGVIVVFLREYFNNPIADAVEEESMQLANAISQLPPESPYIKGEDKVYPYEKYKYYIENMPADGFWNISNKQDAKILESTDEQVIIEIIAGKTDKFNLIYTRQIFSNEEDSIALEITIQSL